MKFSTACLVAMAATLSVAAPADPDCDQGVRFHGHHLHKRSVVYDYKYVTITVDKNGNPIATTETSQAPAPTQQGQQDAQQGQQQKGQQDQALTQPSQSPQPTSTAAQAQDTKVSDDELNIGGVNKAIVGGGSSISVVAPSRADRASTQTSSLAAPTSSSSSSGGSSQGGSGSINGALSPYQNPTEEFQDGVHDCSSFPSGQGVIPLNNLGLGGWSGMYNSNSGKVFDEKTGGLCQDGFYCSYACQPGMSKTQWPSNQPGSGVSVGGLICKGGKLYKSNPNQKYLCEWGVDAAEVVSQLDKSVAICRTDYPGTENMVIPTVVNAGGKNYLTTVYQETYYQWQGKPTSAQYYVNNAGVLYQDGCIWSDAGSGVGNWAPLNFGAGYAAGVSYLSLIPNPNNRDALNFNVKIVAEDGADVSGECKYENGVYNGLGKDGCTVGVRSGRAKFVLYN